MAWEYTPTPLMLPTSHYDKAKADRAVNFIQMLKHTKGIWRGKPFILLPWQEQIVRDIFGVVKEDGYRQFQIAYVEVPKKNGKSDLGAAIALKLLFDDGENAPEVYGAAADRSQASIVFKVAEEMRQMCPALKRRSNSSESMKRMVNYGNAGFYQVLSAEVGTKHGINVSGLIFDELHAQPNRKLFDVLTSGSGDARMQPLFFIITTAGNDKNSICYEQHAIAEDILSGRRNDPTFYPVLYGLKDNEDWRDEDNWKRANPSLGVTIPLERVQSHFQKAINNPAEEANFKQLRLNMWGNMKVLWVPEHIYDLGNKPIDVPSLRGRRCYAATDFSSTSDITACVLDFPPDEEDDEHITLPFFWLPEDTLDLRVRRDHVPYDVWEKQGYLFVTEGNVIDYRAIEHFILHDLAETYNIVEIAYDRWNATQIMQDLDAEGLVTVPFGQGFKDMSPAAKETYKLLMAGKIRHGGHPVLKWMIQNVVMKRDPAGNIKPDKDKSTEKIDGAVALIMAVDRALRHAEEDRGSVYDSRGLFVF